jgi:hypothetical protein
MVKMAELTVETASLGSVGVEEAERDDDDEEETGDHHGDYSCHGNRFYFDTEERKHSELDILTRSKYNTISPKNIRREKCYSLPQKIPVDKQKKKEKTSNTSLNTITI